MIENSTPTKVLVSRFYFISLETNGILELMLAHLKTTVSQSWTKSQLLRCIIQHNTRPTIPPAPLTATIFSAPQKTDPILDCELRKEVKLLATQKNLTMLEIIDSFILSAYEFFKVEISKNGVTTKALSAVKDILENYKPNSKPISAYTKFTEPEPPFPTTDSADEIDY